MKKPDHRSHFLSWGILILAVSTALGTPRSSAADGPNIILLMCDDLGWGDVGFNGGSVIRTPHLDAMAADGLIFKRFYAAAPVCSPTRGSCLTGRHPFRYGVYFANTGHLKTEELTLAELLGRHGYATGHFGKWHLGTLTTTVPDANRGGPDGAIHYAPPWDNGFEVAFSTESKVPTWDPMLKPSGAKAGGHWDFLRPGEASEAYGTAYWNQLGESVEDNLEGDDSRVIMDRVIPFIREATRADRPFFAVVWFHAPHLPVVAGPRHVAAYRDHDVLRRNYYGCVTAMDEQIGRLRRELRRLGVAGRTMQWFCSDNGPEGNDSAPGSAGPFRGRKRSLYEGGVRVPGLLVWEDRVAPGRLTDFPAVTSDYFPTIAEVIGAKSPDQRHLDGTSLLPMLEGREQRRPAPIGFQSRGRAALSGPRFKLIVDDRASPAQQGSELFDLVADPRETRNLAASRPDVVRRMTDVLLEWRRSCSRSDRGRDYPDRD